MTSVLMHTCCAPCSLSCIDPLRAEGIEPVAFWYNPNIHPWKEYEARRDCLLAYAPTIEMQVIVDEDYGLRTFVEHVASDIDHRCTYCYQHRLEETARYAAEHGYEAFTSTLLASLYQDHDGYHVPRRKNTPGSTAWNFSTGISGPISGQGISGPESLAFICRSTAGVSFPNRTATRSRSTGTRKNLRSRHKPAPFCSRKEFLDIKSVAGNRADPVCRYADAVCPALSLAPHPRQSPLRSYQPCGTGFRHCGTGTVFQKGRADRFQFPFPEHFYFANR